MKKVLFFQIKGNSLGGVWTVNKTLGEEFIKRGYEVKILGIRNNHPGLNINDTPLEITTLNEKDVWEIVHKRDVLQKVFKKGFFKTLRQYFKDNKGLKKDYAKARTFIKNMNPDYIIASHYQVLAGIPDEYLKKTIYVQHSSFEYLFKDKKNVKTLKKINNKIHGFAWLSKSAMNQAIKKGFIKNNYIYNPSSFTPIKSADVVNNKKIVVITRIHPEKRIDLMIEIVNDIFKDPKLSDWSFEIYGSGEFNENSKKIMKDSKQIVYKGVTHTPEAVLMTSSITLNTSLYEGFSLSIIEGFSCGIPVISFNFGESAHEQIINDYNGYVIENFNIDKFKETLKKVITNDKKLRKLSKGAKEFSESFSISSVVEKWEKEFEEIDKNG